MPLPNIVNLHELEEPARKAISNAAYDYIAGGADDEVTLRANRAAFGKYAIRPRMLAGVVAPDIATTALGTPISMPVLVAPMSSHRLCHPDGECATAVGVGAADTIMISSTASTRTLEEIAESATAPLWFQLYIYKDRAVTRALVERAVAAGYKALCVTVDTPYLGRRERDIRNRFTLPQGCEWVNLLPYHMSQMPDPGQSSALMAYIATLWDAAITWDDIDWLRSISPLPVLVKGVLTAEDAQLAVEHGAAGIVVSNHGGRQLDGALATLDALPDVVEGAAGAAEIYLDGGVRRGTDVLKALALGARAVLLGRPILWGLALGGAEGVTDVLHMLRAEIELAMALSGVPRLADLDRSFLRPA